MDPTYQGFGAPVPTKNPTRPGISGGKLIMLIAGGLVVILLGVFLLINSGDKTGALQQRLSARLSTMQRIIAEGKKNVHDPELSEINSVISLQVLSDTTTLNTAMKSPKPDDTVVASEADTASFDELKTAALNSRFDAAYRKIIAAKLESTNALIREIYDETSSKSLKTELNTVYGHLKQLQNQLAATSS